VIGDMRNVLVVAAHPDDEVLGVGGTIPRIRACGGRVTVLIVTDGSSTQYPGDDDVPIRKADQLHAANEILGTDHLVRWEFPDMRLDSVEHHQLNRAFEELIRGERFDTVFVHNVDDVNLDHRRIHHSVLVATRPLPGQPVHRLLSYQVNSSTEWGGRTERTIFAPNVFVDIGDTIERKLAAMAAYTDEVRPYPHPRSIQALRERAAVYGTEVGFSYAEPFRLLLARDRSSDESSSSHA
jgi:N-acetylglucosamine malate deacetylase 1